jgi:hypothetical protein
LYLALSCAATEPPSDPHAGCPAHQAVDQGTKLFKTLHEVMAPAWHDHYPNKNHKALGEAIVKFDGMLPDVKKFTHTFKTEERQTNFSNARSRFIELVGVGMAAQVKGDLESVYEIIPELHDQFEMMAFNVLPLRFPEFSSLQIVVDLMIDTHLANEDYDAVVTSLEALKIKNAELQKASIPADLTSVSEQAKTDIADIDNQCRQLEKSCASKDHQAMIDCLSKLKKLCQKFEHDYI